MKDLFAEKAKPPQSSGKTVLLRAMQLKTKKFYGNLLVAGQEISTIVCDI